MPGGNSRRRFLTSVAVLGGVAPLAAPAQPVPGRAGSPALEDLGLAPEERADLEAFARPVLREAARLAELPLDDLDPAFVFVPRG